MKSLLQRFRRSHGGEHPQKRAGTVYTPPQDQNQQNIPKKRLQIHQRCVYERVLPGNAFVSAHVNRLQHGYYESSALHEPPVDEVYFVSVHFVFHPQDPKSHRFKRAKIEVCLHGDGDSPASARDPRYQPPSSHPRILKHAPELMFGAVSPENLQWNFSLSSSLGVAQAPVSATVNPTGGMRGSYKVFHMMSIQGSVRSKRSPLGSAHDVEDIMAVWTLEENILQKSGLPREFDLVMLVHKPSDVENFYMTVNVKVEIEAWCGTYPQWYTNLSRFMPSQDLTFDFTNDIGQRFLPSHSERGFNFASLPYPLDEYVSMPGTVYPTNDTKTGNGDMFDRTRYLGRALMDVNATEASPVHPLSQEVTSPPSPSQIVGPASDSQSKQILGPDTLNVRVVLEHQYPHSRDPQRLSLSPSGPQPVRSLSIRRRKSRSGLKEYGAAQALHGVIQYERKAEQRRISSVHKPKEVV